MVDVTKVVIQTPTGCYNSAVGWGGAEHGGAKGRLALLILTISVTSFSGRYYTKRRGDVPGATAFKFTALECRQVDSLNAWHHITQYSRMVGQSATKSVTYPELSIESDYRASGTKFKCCLGANELVRRR